MKYKNIYSAIHNFGASFTSFMNYVDGTGPTYPAGGAVYLTGLNHMKEKRIQPVDRRQYEKMRETYFTDSDDLTVIADRRIIPDRRMKDISVEWVDDKDLESS